MYNSSKINSQDTISDPFFLDDLHICFLIQLKVYTFQLCLLTDHWCYGQIKLPILFAREFLSTIIKIRNQTKKTLKLH